ncbi:MAG: ribonuclease E/G, partial [Alphaproteobacteria bacterium]|nr:ribonuclease E/G [Alphaproteobacteria bacterium]
EEMQKLRSVYEAIRMRARSASAPALLYEGEDPLYEYIRRHKSSLKKIVINDHNMVSDVEEVVDTATEYTAEPFEKFGLEDQLIEALNPVAKLKSGGEIIIRQTPACVTIDVDSSALRENGSAADLNNEAAVEIARQIRLKNLAGKIVVDFAGSKEYALMRPVIDLLETELADDASCGKVLGLTKAGNIELVRQRRRPSLLEMYTEECPTCQGTGRVEK